MVSVSLESDEPKLGTGPRKRAAKESDQRARLANVATKRCRREKVTQDKNSKNQYLL